MNADLEVVPFTPEHHAEAAGLLARSYSEARPTLPELGPRFEDPLEWLPALESPNPARGPGFAALRNGRLTGFAIPTLTPGPNPDRGVGERLATMYAPMHAVAKEESPFEVYAPLFAALSARLVPLGYFAYSVGLRASDLAALEAWTRLGFGISHVRGLRETARVEGRVAEVEVRKADAEDLEALVALDLELSLYHAGPPVFNALVWDARPIRQRLERNLSDDGSACFVACREAAVVGMMTFARPPQTPFAGTMTPAATVNLTDAIVNDAERFTGVGTALLKQGLEWANTSYEHCLVGWASGNTVAGRFWTSKGFQPADLLLLRRLSSDIAWAHERQSRDDLWRRW